MIKYLLICFVFVFSISCKRCKECTQLKNNVVQDRQEKCGEKLRFAEKNYVEGNGWKCE